MNAKENQSNQARFEYWQNQIILWEESKIKQAEYCRRNNLNKQLFSKWKKRLENGAGKEMSFIEVPIKIKSFNNNKNAIELAIKDIYKIKLYSDFDPSLLKKILAAVEG